MPFFIINIIICPCHLFAIQTKNKEEQFDGTKFSDAYCCRKSGVPRTTVILYYGARQFLPVPAQKSLFSTLQFSRGIHRSCATPDFAYRIFKYRLLHRTFWRVCIRYTGDVIHTRCSTSYSIGCSTWYYIRYT